MKYTQKDLAGIFDQYKSKIYNLALKISRNTDDAKDILQNTFLKVIKNLDKFRNESSLSTWIYRIAVNEAYMKWRLTKRQRNIANFKKEKDLLTGPGSAQPDKQLIGEELKQELNNAIKGLPLKYRVAIILRDFQDLDYSKISKILNISLQSTKTRLHRARLQLREGISNYYKDRFINKAQNLAQMNLVSCGRYLKFLDDLFKDGVSLKNKRLFQKHIQGCQPCKHFIKSYKQAIAVTKCLQCEDIPRDLQLKLNSFLKKRRS